MSSPGTLRFAEVNVKPSAPPVGYNLIYMKTDGILYLQDSSGTETPLGSASVITGLSGDVTATGPGVAVATVVSVGGASAANIAAAVTAYLAATSANTPNTLVERDSSGNFFANFITAALHGNADTATTSISFSGSLSGDVTGTQSSTVVATVGGSTAANIHSAEVAANAATPANTASTIVKRDASGDIFVTEINGVVPEAHEARHLPNGADPLTTAAPLTDLTATSTNAVGTANSLARSDHSHAIDTGIPSTQIPDQSNAAGSSANLARADHIHNIPSGVPVDVGSSNVQGSAATFALSDHVHKGLHSIKANSGAQRFGDVSLQQGAGTTIIDDGSGNFTIDVSGGSSELASTYPGTGLSVNYTAGKVIFNGTETFITSGSVAVPASTTNGYIYVDIDATVKAAITLPPNTVPMAIFNTGLTTVTFIEDARVFLNHSLVWGLDGDIQTLNATNSDTGGTSEKYARADHIHAISTGAPSTQTPDQSNTTGSSTNLARADHIHSIPTAAPTTNLDSTTTNADGVGTAFARNDHSHAITTATPVTQTPDQSNAAGTASGLAKADHIHNIPSGVPVQIGTSNFQGAAASFSLSDHVHSHGNQTSPTLHAVATDSVNGFMSSIDKTKLDASTSSNTPSTLVFRDGSGNFSAGVITADITGSSSSFTGSLSGDVTGTQSATLIAANVVSNSKLAQMPATTIKGNNTGSTANASDLTVSQVNTMLGTVTTVGAIDTNANANGLYISGNTISTQSASASVPGMVNLTIQTFAGNKTFSGQTAVANSSTTAFTVNTSTLIVDATNGAIGIGVAPASTAILDILNNSGSTKAVQLTGYGSNVGLRGRRANGTLVSPSASINGDILSFLSARGYGATGFTAASTGAINFIAGATFTDTSAPTYITFNVTPTGSITSAEAMRIASTGHVLIDTTTDNGTDYLQIGSGLIAGYAKLAGATSGYLNHTVPATVTTYTLTWPSAQGAAGTVPTNDGAGNLSWSNPVTNIDGGSASSVYTASQFINGGTA